ncbi:MAG: hypothetical protein L0220_34415, partial [Acidobacteria bacterium]|nr:hypothetical protein [Acidobacteriota bacterium]
LFYQNNRLVNFAIPVGASGGTQLTAIVPTGLSTGPAQITTVTFDLESGSISDESAPVDFRITVGSLLIINEGEPNDSPDTSTDIFLPSIVDGRAAKDDTGDLFIRFEDGTTETLHDLFLLSLDASTVLTIRLDFSLSADLDLFVLEAVPNVEGSYRVIAISANSSGILEQLSGTLPTGKYLIAVGAYSGSSRYILTVTQGPPVLAGITQPEIPKARQPVIVERKKK